MGRSVGRATCPCLGILGVFSSLDAFAPASVACLLRQRASGTLRKHWSGWRHWTRYAVAHQWQSFQPKIKGCGLFFPRPG